VYNVRSSLVLVCKSFLHDPLCIAFFLLLVGTCVRGVVGSSIFTGGLMPVKIEMVVVDFYTSPLLPVDKNAVRRISSEL